MVAPAKAAVRRARSTVVVGAMLIGLGLGAAPVANADAISEMRGRVEAIRNNDSLCNPIQYSGELEGYAQSWVRDARALATLDPPTFPADAFSGETIGSIASGDPTADAINKLISGSTVSDIKTCGYYQYGVGFIRDDVTELSYVAVIVGKPKEAKPDQGPPVNGLPPAPAAEPEAPAPEPEPEPAAPVQPTATVTSDVDTYDAPGGDGNVTGILRGGSVVDFWGCIEEINWCHVTGAAVPNGDGWVWGDFLQR